MPLNIGLVLLQSNGHDMGISMGEFIPAGINQNNHQIKAFTSDSAANCHIDKPPINQAPQFHAIAPREP